MARQKGFNPERAVEKALNIFWTQGYEATSMQDLVNGMALSRSSIYDTFGDKRSLLILALNRYRHSELAGMRQVLEDAPNGRAGFEALFEMLIQQASSEAGQKGCFMVNCMTELAANDTAVAEIATDNNQAVHQLLKEMVARGQDEGTISPTNSPAELADFIFNAIIGLRVMAKTNPDSTLLRNTVRITPSALT